MEVVFFIFSPLIPFIDKQNTNVDVFVSSSTSRTAYSI